jgi:hypothetical protein
MPEIEITGADTARGTWAMFDYVEFPEARAVSAIGLQGYGHYTEEYVREEGVVAIASLRLSRLRIDPLGAGSPVCTSVATPEPDADEDRRSRDDPRSSALDGGAPPDECPVHGGRFRRAVGAGRDR